ncbi:MAG: hypothetical protein ACYCQJ_12840 [Nitrososphaerales archaeon]
MMYLDALQYAREVRELLGPYCTRIEIAGGIRREKEEPHDIELVCQPRLGTAQDFSLGFGNIEVNHLDQFIKNMLSFDSPFKQGGTVFLIRTGDADFSHDFVTRLWKYGLKCVDGHIEDNKGQICNTPEEKDAFELCHLDYIEPKYRNKGAISL